MPVDDRALNTKSKRSSAMHHHLPGVHGITKPAFTRSALAPVNNAEERRPRIAQCSHTGGSANAIGMTKVATPTVATVYRG